MPLTLAALSLSESVRRRRLRPPVMQGLDPRYARFLTKGARAHSLSVQKRTAHVRAHHLVIQCVGVRPPRPPGPSTS
jgi:hypothetical protein